MKKMLKMLLLVLTSMSMNIMSLMAQDRVITADGDTVTVAEILPAEQEVKNKRQFVLNE